jgi:hypothetical protein
MHKLERLHTSNAGSLKLLLHVSRHFDYSAKASCSRYLRPTGSTGVYKSYHKSHYEP